MDDSPAAGLDIFNHGSATAPTSAAVRRSCRQRNPRPTRTGRADRVAACRGTRGSPQPCAWIVSDPPFALTRHSGAQIRLGVPYPGACFEPAQNFLYGVAVAVRICGLRIALTVRRDRAPSFGGA